MAFREPYFQIVEKIFEIQMIIEDLRYSHDFERDIRRDIKLRFEELERYLLTRWLEFRRSELGLDDDNDDEEDE